VDGSPLPEKLLIDGPGSVFRLEWEPSGERLGIYTGDGWVHLWKPGQPAPSISFPVDAGAKYFDVVSLPQMAFSPDGSRLLVGTSKRAAKIFDMATGKEDTSLAILGDEKRIVTCTNAVDWSRDGTRILTGDLNGMVRICDGRTGTLVREVRACKRGIAAVRFSPDGKMFACASGFGFPKCQVWDVQTGEPVGSSMFHRENVYSVDFSPDGRFLISADASCEAYVWEVGSGRPVGAPIWTGGHTTLVAFHPDGRKALTINWNNVHVWNLGLQTRRTGATCVDAEDARVAPFARKFGIELRPFYESLGVEIPALREIELSSDGNRLLTYVRNRRPLRIIDAQTLDVLRTLPGTEDTIAAYWRPGVREFVTTASGNVRVRDGDTGEVKADLPLCDEMSGAFRPDGGRFAIGTRDYQLRFFDTATWKEVGRPLPHTSRLMSSTYSNDGKLVMTSDVSLTTRLWHASTGKRVGPAFPGYCPCVCADGKAFTVQNGRETTQYEIPYPRNGEVADIVRNVEALTKQ
jgi:WD40 repeat protein